MILESTIIRSWYFYSASGTIIASGTVISFGVFWESVSIILAVLLLDTPEYIADKDLVRTTPNSKAPYLAEIELVKVKTKGLIDSRDRSGEDEAKQ